MQARLVAIALSVAIAVLVVIAAEPYLDRYFFAEMQPRAVTPRGDLAAIERSTIELFERTSPSVVHVFARAAGEPGSLLEENGGGGGGGGGGAQTGTGFIWDAAGHVVTNNHVVENTGAIAVRLASGGISAAEVVGTAPNYDLAVLRLSGARQRPPPIMVGTSADLKVGQFAYAIGNPFGLDQTLTMGIISALQRRLPTSQGREIADVIQTDASINPGNSGGPLLDSAGRLIGVNTAIFSPSGASAGIGFAIPVDVVNRVVPELIRNGRMPTPGIGIVSGSDAVAARLGIEGVVVVRTVPGSPAAAAGLHGVDPNTGRLGDAIVAVNDTPVRRLSDLTAALEKTGIGQTIEITIERGGRRQQIRLSVADMGRMRL